MPASDWSRASAKTGQSRTVDLDAGKVAVLRAYRPLRGALALDLVRDSALVLSNWTALTGTRRVLRRFAGQVARARTRWGRSSR